ncbi:putative secreted protein (Por secretion system target) [Oceanihabitans sediminis]|uniref:T9SS C-terminal target domain-containing protein n=1 Tax=Oceanihabitans sediminis TaxID=1812012 RepID=A0A368P224_9FLAO|nr:T9SS type A sorting domain-containing protein [Oceanihabitans sediminis]RBP30946.1 putative secreted protein (Por secretion system target) [Oceanihabitans sediminis]RCU56902.1 T9SS C-terminal target domain-containing protein [Oceanihabitans sediminis]
MKKNLLLFTTCLCLGVFSAFAQNVNIPDANFKSYLLADAAINTNNDSEISVAEAQAFSGELLINGLSISDLTGIEEFINITRLDCYNNNLTSIDVSNNLALTRLHCSDNQIETLDISANTSITDIQCHNNGVLYELNIANGNNSNINWMKAYGNSLSCIQIDAGFTPPAEAGIYNQGWTKGTSAFYSEDCAALNQIVNIPDANFKSYLVNNNSINLNGDTEITVAEAQATTELLINGLSISDLTGIEAFTNLTRLDCYANNLTTIDVSNNTNLTRLHCADNQITTLDVSDIPTLEQVHCQNNQLVELNVANGNNSNFSYMKAYNNASLTCIQVDAGFSPPANSGQYNPGWTVDGQSSYGENCIPSIFYVNANAIGANDGSSWADAFTNVTDALALTNLNDAVWVAKGTYTLADKNTPIAVSTDEVDIIGGFAGTETTLAERDITAIHTTNATIFTGDINGDDIDGDFSSNKTDNAERLFEVTASDVTFDGIIFENIYDTSTSGGVEENGVIFIPNSSSINNLKIKNSVFRSNYSNGYLLKMRTLNGGLLIENTKFINNTIVNRGLVYVQSDSTNGYIFTRWANVLVADNDINVAALDIYREDWNNGSTLDVIINNSTFVNNDYNGTYGNSITASGNGSVNLNVNNTIFWQNTVNGTAATRDISNGLVSTYDVFIRNSIANVSSNAGTYGGTFSATNVTTLDPATDDLNLDTEYKPTSASNYIVDQGDNAYYDEALFGDLDLSGNTRVFNTTIDLGAYEYNSTLGIDAVSLNTNSVKLYPNPVSDRLFIKSTEQVKNISIYNINGQLVKQAIETTNGIDVSVLPSGLYMIQINTSNNSINQKFLKD